MSSSSLSSTDFAENREDIMKARFMQMVIHHANMAMMMMGRVPNPVSKGGRDLEAAQMFIDQLEMLEDKTRGNLSREEEQLLKQSLMSLRLAFVEAVESSGAAAKPPESEDAALKTPTEESKPEAPPGEEESKEESKKKFSKKY